MSATSMKDMKLPTPAKAKEMLRDGNVKGRPLSPGQKRLFGMIAAGKLPGMMKVLKRRKKVA